MTLANEWLDIHLFVTPNELTDGLVDEKSLMVYLAQFPTAKLRSGAPLRAQRSSNRYEYYSHYYLLIRESN